MMINQTQTVPVLMSQEFSFSTLIGQGVKLVNIWYDYDDDTNSIDNLTVTTEEGDEIDQYLTEDTLDQLEMDCYKDHDRQMEEAVTEYRIDCWIDAQYDRMAA
jgi:hypothetical protein